jgi:hypothetical protein
MHFSYWLSTKKKWWKSSERDNALKDLCGFQNSLNLRQGLCSPPPQQLAWNKSPGSPFLELLQVCPALLGVLVLQGDRETKCQCAELLKGGARGEVRCFEVTCSFGKGKGEG